MRKYRVFTNDDLWPPSVRCLPEHVRRIIDDKVLNFIGVEPYNAEELSYELTGLWSYNNLKTGGRIIYAICEDCRKKRATIMNNCKVCGQMANDIIMLWVFTDHDYEELRRGRERAWSKMVKQKRHERGH
jgi:hypothetical protein